MTLFNKNDNTVRVPGEARVKFARLSELCGGPALGRHEAQAKEPIFSPWFLLAPVRSPCGVRRRLCAAAPANSPNAAVVLYTVTPGVCLLLFLFVVNEAT